MCGIVGAVADRDVVPILIEGLKRLEYRGYDSAGHRGPERRAASRLALRTVGKVAQLSRGARRRTRRRGPTRHRAHALGDARRADERNAHPHVSRDGVAIVHNGIIENHEELRAELERARATSSPPRPTPRSSRTASTITCAQRRDLFEARAARPSRELEGAYALAVMCEPGPGPHRARARGLPGASSASATSENFVASDVAALLPVTRTLHLSWRRATSPRSAATASRSSMRPASRSSASHYVSEQSAEAAEKGTYRALHAEGDPRAAARGRADAAGARGGRSPARAGASGRAATEVFEARDVRCTSSPAAPATTPASSRATSSSSSAGVPCRVEIASEYRYRDAGGAGELAVRVDFAVGRDGGHAGGAAACAQGGFPVHARHLQRAGELAGARVRARAADARRARRSASPRPRPSRPSSRRSACWSSRSASTTACRRSARTTLVQRLLELPALLEQTLALDPLMRALARKIRAESTTRCSSAAARCSRSRWKAR